MAEVQSDWDRLLLEASPFNLVKIKQENLFVIAKALKRYFMPNPKSPMKIKQVRVIKISADVDYIQSSPIADRGVLYICQTEATVTFTFVSL